MIGRRASTDLTCYAATPPIRIRTSNRRKHEASQLPHGRVLAGLRMTEAQTASSSTVTRRSKRSSLVAKCKAPFSAKQRSFIEQEIRLDEPFRLYVPGDSVKGAVHLIFGKPTRITHLVVCLRGFVKVLNNELPGEKTIYDKPHLSSSSGGGKRGLEYFGDGLACLFQDETVLCGEGRVSGQYEFRFELILPSKNVPSSIDVCDQNRAPNQDLDTRAN